MTHRASLLGRGYPDRNLDSPRLRFRRALSYTGLTIVAPGTPQLLVGNRWAGRLALFVWMSVIGAAAYLGWLYRTDRSRVLGWATDPDLVFIGRIVLVVAAVLWLALFVDAWRLAGPRRLRWFRGVTLTAVNLAVIMGVVGSTAMAAQLMTVQRDVVKTVFTATETSEPLQGRYNILLIGSDSHTDRVGLRPDSMTVASIDADTGRVVLVSLPRNLQNVPFSEDSPLRQVWPYGYNCGPSCLLNAVHTMAAGRTDLYPGSDDPGLEATIDAVEGATNLKINYYAMINMQGLRSLVNAVGGVEVNVKTRLAMFGREDAWKNEWIEPGLQTLTGYQALWYARSRVQSDDYVRMGRQKCLMAAMLDQLDPQTVLFNATEIGRSSTELLSTNIPQSELGKFADLALKARGAPISTVSLVPPQVNVASPNYALIHQMIDDAVNNPPTPTPTPTDAKEDLSQRSANQAADLKAAC